MNIAAAMPLIDLNNIVKTYKTGAGEFTALKSVSLEIGRGEFVSVVGKSGCGKSTMLNMITGIDRPTSGEVIINGISIHELSEGDIAKWRGRNIGVVFQFFQLLPTLTILENILIPMDLSGLFPTRERKQRAFELGLTQVPLADGPGKRCLRQYDYIHLP